MNSIIEDLTSEDFQLFESKLSRFITTNPTLDEWVRFLEDSVIVKKVAIRLMNEPEFFDEVSKDLTDDAIQNHQKLNPVVPFNENVSGGLMGKIKNRRR